MKSVLLAAVLAIGTSAKQLIIYTPSVSKFLPVNPSQINFPAQHAWSRRVRAIVDYLVRWKACPLTMSVPILLPLKTVQPYPVGPTIAKFNHQTGTVVTWIVKARRGTSLVFEITDGTGRHASSGPFDVITGSGDSCLE
ncbi:hypothetical protein C8R43DRAFT_1202209 [Mycena crocata]|nr:hypothetical protein C8R43DRAFT_1202209 [Mycena crocata]